MIANPLYWGTKLAMGIIIAFNAFHLTRTIGGDQLLAWCLAGAIVIGVFCLDGLIAAILVGSKNNISMTIAVALAAGSLFCHWYLYKASAAAFAVADHQTIQAEVNDSEEVYAHTWLQRTLMHQIAATKNPKTKKELTAQLAEHMVNKPQTEGATAKEKGLAAVGQDVGTMSDSNAALMELVAILLGLANGAWLATQVKREEDSEPINDLYMYEPEQAKTLKKPEAQLRVGAGLEDMVRHRHPTHDNTPGYKRAVDEKKRLTFSEQYEIALANADQISSIDKVKKLCKCQQQRATQIKNKMVAEGVGNWCEVRKAKSAA